MGLLLDVSPLRESRAFRLLYAGEAVSFFGSQLTAAAARFQVYELTHSTLQVGLLSLAQLPFLFVGSMFGGPLADAHDRRRLLLVVNVAMLACSAGLVANAALERPQVWLLYLLTSCTAGFSGIESPTRNACIPNLVRPEKLPAAAALHQMIFQFGLAFGPMVAGLVIGLARFGAVYGLDVVSFVAAIGLVALLPAQHPAGGGTKASLSSLVEGWRFLRTERAVQGTFVVDVNAMVFGMPRAVFPEMARRTFGGGAATFGLLDGAPGIGALVGAVTSGWVSRVERQGRAVFVAVALWGAAIVCFGFSPWLWLALVMLALAGWADMISAVFRNTILHLSVPDRLRGRLSAIHIAVVTGGPRLGDLEAGGVARLADVRVAAWSGGLACLAGCAVIARAFPALARWRIDRDAATT